MFNHFLLKEIRSVAIKTEFNSTFIFANTPFNGFPVSLIFEHLDFTGNVVLPSFHELRLDGPFKHLFL